MQAVNALLRLGTGKLLEANQAATELLLKGAVVDGVEGWDQGRGRTVHFIDWDNPDNNVFRAINQFQVACPTGQADKHIRPDLVLFVNGIPLVVVECKSPYAATPLVDEAHRSHTNTAHANLMRALPNCAKIGFTGTPIIMRDKGQTARIFGEFIDRYTLRESEADGATVPILYEGRTTGAAVEEGGRWTMCSRTCLADARPRSWRRLSKSTRPRATSWRPSGSSPPRPATCCATTWRTSCPTASRPRWWRSVGGRRSATTMRSGRPGTSWSRSWRPCTRACSTWTTTR